MSEHSHLHKSRCKRGRDSFSWSNSSTSSSLTLLSTLVCILAHKRRKERQPRQKSFIQRLLRFRDPLTFDEIATAYGPEMFRKAFRMSRPAFDMLLDTVKDLLGRPFKAPTEYRRGTIPADIRLAITLRLLAGASYYDLYLAYQVGETTIRNIFTTTCDALMSSLQLKGFPSTDAGLRVISNDFQTSRKSPSPLSGCVGALDGICIKIKKPADDDNPVLYFSRKGFYSIPVQALAESKYIFRFCSVNCAGATHDSLEYSVSGLNRELERGVLGDSFYIVGDEAYTCTEQLITPFPKSGANRDQDNFNFFLSSLRIHVEQAFGMLVARWRILRGGLDFSVKRCTDLICLLMKLHNFCPEYDPDRKPAFYDLNDEDRIQLEAEVSLWCRDSRALARELQDRPRNEHPDHDGVIPQRSRSDSNKRNRLVALVNEKGMCRPGVILPRILYETRRQ